MNSDYFKNYSIKNRKRIYELAKIRRQKNKYKQTERSLLSYRLRKNFGISFDLYCEIREKQKDLCAICFKKDTRRLAVDHCHKTKKVRGLLCMKCNRAIGLLNDDIEIAKMVVNYLKNNSN